MPDPGPLYTGELPRLGVVVNEPLRRGRVTGTDLLPWFSRVAPVDVFGMKGEGLPSALGVSPAALSHAGNLSTSELQGLLATRRVYLHPFRWTSLGLALLEAMHLGMPVVGLATTEVARAVPPEAGLVSNDLDELSAGIRRLIDDPAFAVERGLQARRHALEHYGLRRLPAGVGRRARRGARVAANPRRPFSTRVTACRRYPRNAEMPVMCWPRMRVCTSSVPS